MRHSHAPKILCRICRRLETMPVGEGLPECDCAAGGAGPCKTAICLRCADEVLAERPPARSPSMEQTS